MNVMCVCATGVFKLIIDLEDSVRSIVEYYRLTIYIQFMEHGRYLFIEQRFLY